MIYGNESEYGQRSAKLDSLRRDATYIGVISLMLTVLMQFLFLLILLVLAKLGIAELSGNDSYYGLGSTRFLLIYALVYSIGMGLPAPLLSAITRRRVNPFARYESARPDSSPMASASLILAILAGLSMCVLANMATSYLMYYLNQLGIPSPEFPSYLENTGFSLFLNVVIFALLPAIFEEMLYRGYFLRTLLAYGEKFAIIVSAVLFALMHGNIIQIPFAFIVGLACGYLVVKTGYIWPAVMLHFLNNFMSTLLEYVQFYTISDDQYEQMILIVFSIIGLIGLVCLLALFAKRDRLVSRFKSSELPAGERAAALFVSPVFTISVVVSCLLTILSVVTTGGV